MTTSNQEESHNLNLETLRPWVEAETGMDFAGNRMTRLRDAVDKVFPRSQSAALEKLLSIPQERGVFLERLTAELTIGESFFFRNEHHIHALREQVLPEILRDNADKREIRLWSAGCAGGEEPYSLAIVLDQVLGGQGNWRVSILGTDLNPQFLERARAASYRPWSFRQTNIHEDRSFFSRNKDTYQVEPRIREHVRFSYLNLVKDVYPSPLTGTLGLDLIAFRNVAIYLKPEVTKRIIERFHQALRPGGWLLLGEAEVSLAPTHGFEVRRFEQATFHQKSHAAASAKAVIPSRPVLADFAISAIHPPTAFGNTALCPSAIPNVPSVPDWLPLPKKTKAGETFPTSGIPAGTQFGIASSSLPQIERLLSEQRFDAAELAISSISDPKHRADGLLRLAKGLLMIGAVERARQMLDRCLAEEPMLVEGQLLKASFAEEAGDLDQAEQAYRRALYVDRNCPMAHFHLGLLLQHKGDALGSNRSFKTTLKLIENQNPHDLVQYGEGVCYGRLKEMLQMIVCF